MIQTTGLTERLGSITFPTGGSVSYTWAPNPQSELASFPDDNGDSGGCDYIYDSLAVQTRSVSYDGSTTALTRDFAYSTTWNPSNPTDWSTKTTTVTTIDNVTGLTSTTVYTYSPFVVETPPDDPSSIGPQVPLEQTVTYEDGNGKALRTATKTWLDQYLMTDEKTTLDSGATSETSYKYTRTEAYHCAGTGSQLTDKYEYDHGGALLRHTHIIYASFPATPIYTSGPSIFDRPSSVVIYDGSGNRVAETDYAYDQTAVNGPSGVTQHDDANYGSSYNNRANTTTKTEWLSTGGASPVTTYTYHDTGQMVSMTDPCGNSTCGDMSGSGHTTLYSYADSYASGSPPSQTKAYLTQITYPNTGVAHVVKFSYNYADGQLASSTDQNGNPTTYGYNDPLDPLTGKSYSDGEPAVTFGYDGVPGAVNCPAAGGPSDPVGNRTSTCDAAGTETWGYDQMNSITSDQRTTNGVTKTTSYAYYLDGTLKSLAYPSERVVNYQVGGAELPLSATDGGSGVNYVSNAAYAPQEALATASLAGGNINLTQSYSSRLQPSTIHAISAGGTDPLDLAYDFGLGTADNGDVRAIVNNWDTTRTQYFDYDALNRIDLANTQTATGTNSWGQAFGYDTWGSLASVTVTQGSATSLSVAVNANNQLAGAPYSYDADGNVLTDAVNTYTWNADGKMASVSNALSGTTTYLYDGDGRRVEKSSGKPYWYGIDGNVLSESDLSGNITDDYIFFGGRRIARVDAKGNVDYHLGDAPGSARVVTDSNGNILDDCDFLPFGDEQCVTASSGNTYQFTGMELDSESGLNHTLNRQLSSIYDRWLSPDPANAGANPQNPQSWNAYSYAGNNPTTITDPTGKDRCATSGSDRRTDFGNCVSDARYNQDRSKYSGYVHVEQQNNDPDQRESLAAVLYNETAGLRATAKSGVGSARNLHNGREGAGEVAHRLIRAGHPKWVAPGRLTAAARKAIGSDPAAPGPRIKIRSQRR